MPVRDADLLVPLAIFARAEGGTVCGPVRRDGPALQRS